VASKLIQGAANTNGNSNNVALQVYMLSNWDEQIAAIRSKGMQVCERLLLDDGLKGTNQGVKNYQIAIESKLEAIGVGTADLVVVAVKSPATEAAAVQAAQLLASDGVVITLQVQSAPFAAPLDTSAPLLRMAWGT
jgi:hypothetical protein